MAEAAAAQHHGVDLAPWRQGPPRGMDAGFGNAVAPAGSGHDGNVLRAQHLVLSLLMHRRRLGGHLVRKDGLRQGCKAFETVCPSTKSRECSSGCAVATSSAKMDCNAGWQVKVDESKQLFE